VKANILIVPLKRLRKLSDERDVDESTQIPNGNIF